MTWTTPRTWATGDEITATRLNEQLRDNMLELRSSRTARVRRLTAQSIPDSADPWATAIGFTSEDFDVPAWHSNTTNNTRITPDVAGVYLVTANVEFAANATGDRAIRIGVNGVGTSNMRAQTTTPAPTVNALLSTTAVVLLNGTTDYIEIGAWQSSGGSLNTGTSLGCWCSVTWIGA